MKSLTAAQRSLMHFAQCFAAFMACDGMERRDLGMPFDAYQLHRDCLYVATQETL